MTHVTEWVSYVGQCDPYDWHSATDSVSLREVVTWVTVALSDTVGQSACVSDMGNFYPCDTQWQTVGKSAWVTVTHMTVTFTNRKRVSDTVQSDPCDWHLVLGRLYASHDMSLSGSMVRNESRRGFAKSCFSTSLIFVLGEVLC